MSNRNKPWFTIKAKSADEAELLIYDEISPWGMDAGAFVRELNGIDAKTLHVRINSPGGSVPEGMAMYNALQRHSATVITHVDGLAASIASVIALAGSQLQMSRGSFLMIHNPYAMVVGNADELRRTADTLEKVGDELVGIYSDAADQTKRQVREWMAAETWFTADEAVKHGFAQAVDPSAAQISASLDLSRFQRVPSALRMDARGDDTDPQIQTIRDFESFLRDEGGFSHARARQIATQGFRPQSDPRDEDDEPAWLAGARALTASLVTG